MRRRLLAGQQSTHAIAGDVLNWHERDCGYTEASWNGPVPADIHRPLPIRNPHGTKGPKPMALPPDYAERVYAGVLGKIIGVYLGRPFEGWTYEDIKYKLGEIWYYVHDRLGHERNRLRRLSRRRDRTPSQRLRSRPRTLGPAPGRSQRTARR